MSLNIKDLGDLIGMKQLRSMRKFCMEMADERCAAIEKVLKENNYDPTKHAIGWFPGESTKAQILELETNKIIKTLEFDVLDIELYFSQKPRRFENDK